MTNIRPYNPNWNKLRSDIYIRDKGICWICNTFVNLKDYDLGHLIDKCNGGYDDYDNLAVMHSHCNLSKPFHNTLEECLKWKLTAFIPHYHNNISNISNYNYQYVKQITKHKNIKHKPFKVININEMNYKQKLIYEENIKKIKPNTICWIQGRPLGGAMWKVLPPPYTKDNIFSMRQTPLGAIDNGKSSIQETIQVINGLLTEVINLNLGHYTYTIEPSPNSTIPIIKFRVTNLSNCNKLYSIGKGKHQIPFNEWSKAKQSGINFNDFKEQWRNNKYNQ